MEQTFRTAVLLSQAGQLSDAARLYQELLREHPNQVAILNNLGGLYFKQGRFEEAVVLLRKAIKRNSKFAQAHFNLGNTLQQLYRLKEAVVHYKRAIVLNPAYAEAHSNLADALLSLRQPGEAIQHYRKALNLDRNFAHARTNLIFALNFLPSAGPKEQQSERARWFEEHAKQLAGAEARHANTPDPNRRLRIGYVSSYFRHQAATYAFTPVVLNHDPAHFEVFCYSDTAQEDDLTKIFRDRVKHWRRTVGVPDSKLADIIRADAIDILVDLVGHMSGHRLLVFAGKPAPVQVTGWGEPTGTGLKSMDYLLADPVLVPMGIRPLLAENVIDLPCFLSYWTPAPLPQPGPLPALANGYVTFGSFNRITKISDTVLRSWSAILRAVPRARLVLKHHAPNESDQHSPIRSVFMQEGIDLDRVTFLSYSDRETHFGTFDRIDIALDPFPHSGGMTTLDALWMGVPVVTCPGDTISSRLAAASLAALGLGDYIAPDQARYVSVAATKATNLPTLAALRSNLRSCMAASPIGDSVAYTRAVETAYRDIWRRWCG